MGLKQFLNEKVNIKFIKASLAVLITVAFIFLLSFSVKIFNSFADPITPEGLLYTSDEYDYYKNCYTNKGTTTVVDLNVTCFDMSASPTQENKVYAYLYDDGMLVLDGSGNIPGTYSGFEYSASEYKNKITKAVTSINGFAPSRCTSLFKGLSNLTSVDLSTLDLQTNNCTLMESMFSGCSSLTSIDFTGVNTSGVTHMGDMFNGCSSLTSITFGDSFDTSYVENFIDTFRDTGFKTLDLSGFNTVSVKWMNSMFYDCKSLKSINFGSDINLANVTEMKSMFNGCTCLQSVNIDFSSLVSKVDATSMFYECSSLKKLNLNNLQNKGSDLKISGNKSLREIILPKYLNISDNLPSVIDAKWYGFDINDQKIDDTEYTQLPRSIDTNTNGIFESGELYKVKLVYDYLYKDQITGTKYYADKYIENGIEKTDLKQFHIGDNPSDEVYAYVYGDGMLLFDGYGKLEYSDNATEFPYRYTAEKGGDSVYNSDLITKAAASNNGFKVNRLDYLFKELKKITRIDFSNFDTSNVTNMYQMFYNCSSLIEADLSNFDTSNVEKMYYMFAGCNSLTNVDVSSFDTSNVTDMSAMFQNCSSLTTLDISSFDTSKVSGTSYLSGMSRMFYGCTNLETLTLDKDKFDTSKVYSMYNMFYNCKKLKSIDISKFNTSNCHFMNFMFEGCESLTALDLSNFDTSNVEDMDAVFRNCKGLTTLDVSSFDTSKVTKMSSMFYCCSSLTTLDISSFKTSSVAGDSFTAGMYDMFYGCTSLETLTFDKDKFDTSNVYSMYNMFDYCKNLKSIDTSKFNTSNCHFMSCMFEGCELLTTLDLSNFDTSNVEDMRSMFSNCIGLTTLDLSNFNTSNVTYMNNMFAQCKTLTTLDLSNYNTSNVTEMSGMFSNMDNIKNLNIRNFDLSNITDSSKLPTLKYNKTLSEIVLPKNISSVDIVLPNVTGKVWKGYDIKNAPIPGATFTNLPKSINSNGNSSFDDGELYKIKLRDPAGLLYEDTANNKKYYEDGYKVNDGELIYDGLQVFDMSISPSEPYTASAYLYDDGTLILDGSGYLCYDYDNGFISPTNGSSVKRIVVSNNGFTPVGSCELLFNGINMSNLTSIDLTGIDTSNVTNMTGMFGGCESVTSINFGSHFDTSNVKYMNKMFSQCCSIEELTLDFDTSNVEEMNKMFSYCTKLKTLNLGNDFDTCNVEYMNEMFAFCVDLENIDLTKFNINSDSVKELNCMFALCGKLDYVNLSTFDLSNLEDNLCIDIFGHFETYSIMVEYGYDYDEIKALYNSMFGTIADDIDFCVPSTIILPMKSFEFDEDYEVLPLITRPGTYYEIQDIEGNRLGVATTLIANEKGKNGNNTFDAGEAYKLVLKENILYEENITNEDSTVTNKKYLVNGYKENGVLIEDSLKATFDLSEAQDESMMAYLYSDGTLIFDGKGYYDEDNKYHANYGDIDSNYLDIKNYSLYNSAKEYSEYASTITRVRFSNNGYKPNNMSYAFYGLYNLTDIDFTNLDTSELKYAVDTFAYCTSLTSLDLSSLNFNNLMNMTEMFIGCVNLRTLSMGQMTPINGENPIEYSVKFMDNAFTGCINLESLNLENMIFNINGLYDISINYYFTSNDLYDVNPFDNYWANNIDLTELSYAKNEIALKIFNSNNDEYLGIISKLNCSDFKKLETIKLPIVLGGLKIRLPEVLFEVNEYGFTSSKFLNGVEYSSSIPESYITKLYMQDLYCSNSSYIFADSDKNIKECNHALYKRIASPYLNSKTDGYTYMLRDQKIYSDLKHGGKDYYFNGTQGEHVLYNIYSDFGSAYYILYEDGTLLLYGDGHVEEILADTEHIYVNVNSELENQRDILSELYYICDENNILCDESGIPIEQIVCSEGYDNFIPGYAFAGARDESNIPRGISSLKRVDFSQGNIKHWEIITGAFNKDSNLEIIDLSGVDFSNIDNIDNAHGIFSLMSEINAREFLNMMIDTTGASEEECFGVLEATTYEEFEDEFEGAFSDPDTLALFESMYVTKYNNFKEIILPIEVPSNNIEIKLPVVPGKVFYGADRDGNIDYSKTYTKLVAQDTTNNLYKLVTSGELLFTDPDGVKYFTDGTSKDDDSYGDDKITLDKVISLGKYSSDDLCAYVYSNGMMVFDGEGTLKKDYYSSITEYNDAIQSPSVTKIAISNNGYKANDVSGMFIDAYYVTDIYQLDKIDLSGITNNSYVSFRQCYSLTNIELSSDDATIDMTKITKFDLMFMNCFSLSDFSIIEKFTNTSNVTSVYDMFDHCFSLVEIDLSTLTLGENVTDMSSMFSYDNNLTTVTFPSSIDTQNVDNMSYMFFGCYNLSTINGLDKFNTSSVTDFTCMFTGCTALDGTLDISNFEFSSDLNNLYEMFSGCINLESIIVKDNLTIPSGCDVSCMFEQCKSLINITWDGLTFNWDGTDDIYGMFDGCNSLKTLDLSGFDLTNLSSNDELWITYSNDLDSYRGSSDYEYDINTDDYNDAVEFISGYENNPISSFNAKGDFEDLQDYLEAIAYVHIYDNYKSAGPYSFNKIILPALVNADSTTQQLLPIGENEKWVAGDIDGNVIDRSTSYTTIIAATETIKTLVKVDTCLYEDTTNNIKYYKTGTNKTEGDDSITLINSWDITKVGVAPHGSPAGSLMVYLYSDGTMIFDGEGVNKYYVYSGRTVTQEYRPWTNSDGSYSLDEDYHVPIRIVISDNGFKPTNLDSLFANYKGTKFYNFDKLDTSSCRSMNHTFRDNSKLEELDVSNFVIGKENEDDTQYVTSMQNTFQCGSNDLLEITGLNKLDTSKVTNMTYMFNNASKNNNFTLNLFNFDTSSATTFYGMFGNLNVTSLNLSNFVTTNVTDMNNMFYGMHNITEIDMSNFDTSKVEDFKSMFNGCSSLETVKIKLNDTALTDVTSMFNGCGELKTIDLTGSTITKNKLPLSTVNSLEKVVLPETISSNISLYTKDGHYKWVEANSSFTPLTTEVTHDKLIAMSNETNGAKTLVRIEDWLYDDGVTKYYRDGTNNDSITLVKKLSLSPNNSGNLKAYIYSDKMMILDGEGEFGILNTFSDYKKSQNVTKIAISNNGFKPHKINLKNNYGIFRDAYYVTDIYQFDKLVKPLDCTDMSSLFEECYSLTNIGFTSASATFDTSGVTDMSSMFESCYSLADFSILDRFTDYSSVTNIRCMFENCHAVTELDLSNFNFGSVNKMDCLFNVCINATTIKLPSTLDTSSVEEMDYLFGYCFKLTNIVGLDKLDTSSVTCFEGMFSVCKSLSGTLNLSNFEFSDGLEYLDLMFAECFNLEKIIFKDNLVIPSGCETYCMFEHCHNLNQIQWDGLTFNWNGYRDIDGMFDGCNNLETLDLSGFNLDNLSDNTLLWITYDNDCSQIRNYNCHCKYDMDEYVSIVEAYNALENPTIMDYYDAYGYILDIESFGDCLSAGPYKLNKIILPTSVNSASSLQQLLPTNGVREKWVEADSLFNPLTPNVKHDTLIAKSTETNGAKTLVRINDVLYKDSSNVEYYRDGTSSDDITLLEAYDISLAQDHSMYAYLYSNNTLIYDGTGENINYFVSNTDSSKLRPWKDYLDNIDKIVISNNGFKPTNIDSLFASYKGTTFYQFDKLDTSLCTSMDNAFSGSNKLTSIDLSKFNTSNVTNMEYMFSGCSKLTSLDFSKFDTSKVTNFDAMLASLDISSLDLSYFDTSSATSMYVMFWNDPGLTTLDISNFDLSNVRDMTNMFKDCRNLTSLKMKVNDSALTSCSSIFLNDSKLTTLDLTGSTITGNVFNLSTGSALTKIILPDSVASATANDSSNPSLPTKTWVKFKSNGDAYNSTLYTTLPAKTEIGDYLGTAIPLSQCTFSACEVEYDGTAKKPDFAGLITFNTTTLVPGTDYTVSDYANNVEAGTATCTITGKGAYTGKKENVSFTIKPKAISVNLGASDYEATLKQQKDYDGTTNAESKSLTINGVTYQEEGSDTPVTEIINISLTASYDSSDAGDRNMIYHPTVTSVTGGHANVSNYRVSYDNIDGSNNVTLNNYGKINGIEIHYTLSNFTKVYDGNSDITLTITLDDPSGILEGQTIGNEGTDVIIPSAVHGTFDSKNVGSDKSITVDTITLTGDKSGNYYLVPKENVKGSITKKLLTYQLGSLDKTFDGTNTNNNVTVTNLEGIESIDEGKVTISSPITATFISSNVGTYYSEDHASYVADPSNKVSLSEITLSGTESGDESGNYKIEQPTSYSGTISALGLTSDMFKAISDMTYTGSEIKPSLEVSDDYISKLDLTKDIEVTYTDNIDKGKATVTISPKDGGNFENSANVTLHFEILAKDIEVNLADEKYSTLLHQEKTYDGTDAGKDDLSIQADGVTGETLVITLTSTYEDKNVGTKDMKYVPSFSSVTGGRC
ncbi:MAG: BspA family leucine-rich repeat surface protein, partial [Clostridia bacterium]|nr:BspA family leucine-rich repeat surface protein [Clostridia bacterium]